MVDAATAMDVDDLKMNGQDPSQKTLKRKRASPAIEGLNPEQRLFQIRALNQELEGLFSYYREMINRLEVINSEFDSCSSLNSMVALLMEEKELPLSKLVDEIHVKVKEKVGTVTTAAVKSAVLFIGQRLMYGVPNFDADVLEDETQSCLRCWETRDLKLMPKHVRGLLKIRRTCRRKIHERITAVSAMIAVLEKCESGNGYKPETMRALEKLGKVLSETDIRILMDNMLEKNGADVAEKKAKLEEKMLIKQLERNKREAEKEKKRMEREKEREMQNQRRKNEKKQKRLQEIEKEERRRDESEIRKQLRKQQEEAEKEQRRREKEQAEQKKQLAIQKQASIMARFLKTSKMPSADQNEFAANKPAILDSQGKKSEIAAEAVTQSMDSALSSTNASSIDDLRKLHLASWHKLGSSIRSNSSQHWGRRRKPRIELFRELKLSSGSGITQDDELNNENGADWWKEKHSDSILHINYSDTSISDIKLRRKKQLLQFDKSYRPAFYGAWPKQSQVIGARHPLRKDPDLDYDVDSDEEWEEEEPGESLSDCDKDEEEGLDDGCSKIDEEDESEDGFFVPDGYLSENEGVQVDRMEADCQLEESRSSTTCKEELELEEFRLLLRQQKHLHSLTEQALRKNQPLIITNLMHEKTPVLVTEDICSTLKMEQACLQALSMRLFPGCQGTEIFVDNIQDVGQEVSLCSDKGSIQPVSTIRAIKDTDVPAIVSVIQSCAQGKNKVVEALQKKFPDISKSQLRNKVREISDFQDNRWQVKRDVLLKFGFSTSPDKGSGRPKSIVSFFSKRCLPPLCKATESTGTPPLSSEKGSGMEQQLHFRSDNV